MREEQTTFLILAGNVMTEQKFYSPLKIGLLIVTLSYFLFNFHSMFTLSWIGEWEPVGGYFGFVLLVEDIFATIGLVFRFAASIIALAAIIFYFAKKGLSKPRTYLILRLVLVFEAIYWLGLLPSAVYGVQGVLMFSSYLPIMALLDLFVASVLPCLLESIAIPIALFILAYKLSPNKPVKGVIKWGLISGTVFVIVFWLLNTGIWMSTIPTKGTEYLTSYPQNMLSFLSTLIGLLALSIYSGYVTKKYSGTETLQELNLKPVGVIILGLGMYYLWNYLTWIFFGGDYIWSDWYAWFLGHTMDLWIMTIPLVGVPLLFEQKTEPNP
jgi:hypothetical protein